MKESTFFSPIGSIFSVVQRQIDVIIRPSEALWSFRSSPSSRCRSHLVKMVTFFQTGSCDEVHCFDFTLAQWDHDSCTVRKRSRNSFWFRLNSVKGYCEMVSRLRFLSGMKSGIHYADNFLMPNISFKIWPVRSFEITIYSTILRTNPKIVDFYHVILQGNHVRSTLVWLIKNQRLTTLKLFKPKFDEPRRNKKVTVQHSSVLWFHSAISIPKARIKSSSDIALFSFICNLKSMDMPFLHAL